MSTMVEDLGAFVAQASWDDLSAEATRELQVRILDSFACALGARRADPVRRVRAAAGDLGGGGASPGCTLIGDDPATAGTHPPDRAALVNGSLVRYLDFNDSYLAPGETGHPSDNLAPVLAACEYADRSGRDLLVALAVAYQVQCRLSDEAPVRHRGFDHTTQGAYAAAAGVARALGLDATQAAHAVAIAGTALCSLRVTRTGALSHWKALAYPFTAAAATEAAFLAARGVTGPGEVFEGTKGLMDAISGPFELDWSAEDLERVRHTIIKRYNAEIHSQSALEAALELRAEHDLDPAEVERVELEVFDVAHDIIGGGAEGDKTRIARKEEADHSLPWLLAVALLDGQVLPAQYEPDRIVADDVQDLLRRVEIRPADDLSARFPEEHACRLRLHLRDGRVLARDKSDYEGFHTRPMRWDQVVAKLDELAGDVDTARRTDLVETVERLGEVSVRELTGVLSLIGAPPSPDRATDRTTDGTTDGSTDGTTEEDP